MDVRRENTDVRWVGFHPLFLLHQCNKTFFPLSLTSMANKVVCLYQANTFQSSVTFAGNHRRLPKEEASERCSNGQRAAKLL